MNSWTDHVGERIISLVVGSNKIMVTNWTYQTGFVTASPVALIHVSVN